MQPITINLSESRNARVFDESSLVHYEELNKATCWIQERIDILKNQEEQKNGSDCRHQSDERLHDTISILGGRGSGKTSFIKSLLDKYKENDDIAVIDIIDPTLIEEKGHIFLTIMSQIAKMVEKKISENGCNTGSQPCFCKTEWDNQSQALAARLSAIDGAGGGFETCQGPEFCIHKGFNSVQLAKSLENDFYNFVELALEILEKKLFILALDDIDIDFCKGWPVLETIRKYLTSPRIITLLSGDIKLFFKAVRKKQWKNFSKALVINEGEKFNRMVDYDDLVTEMGGQYLQKVMQPQRRIHLTTLYEKIYFSRKKSRSICIEYNQKNEKGQKTNSKAIVDYYNDLLSQFGIVNPSQAEEYRSFLLSLPIRTQIQFLSAFDNISRINEVDVMDTFLSDLYEKRVDIDTAKSSYKHLNPIILKLLIKEKVLDEAYQLQPTTTDSSLNSALTSLSFLFSQKTIDYPYLIFEYFIKIGYTRNLLSILGYQEKENGKTVSLKSPSIEGLCKHASIYSDASLKSIACCITSYIQAILDKDKKEKNSFGMIKFPRKEVYRMLKLRKENGNMPTGKYPFIFERENIIASFPLSISQHNRRNEGFAIYSVYVLLATIGELIKKVEVKDTLNGIYELSQIRSYPMPLFGETSSSDTYDIEGPFDLENTIEEESFSFLVPSIKRWIDAYPKKEMYISPQLLGKISNRFFYALSHIENRETSKHLGDSMHKRIIALMNSILVEDVKENLWDKVILNINSPINNNEIFFRNIFKLNNLTDIGNKLSFSRWMLSCPLLLIYLNTENDYLLDTIAKFSQGYIDSETVETIKTYSIYSFFSSIVS